MASRSTDTSPIVAALLTEVKVEIIWVLTNRALDGSHEHFGYHRELLEGRQKEESKAKFSIAIRLLFVQAKAYMVATAIGV